MPCQLSFYVTFVDKPQDGDSITIFKAFVDGQLLVDASNPIPVGTYQQYTAMFQGSGVSQSLVFEFQNNESYYLLDDVSVTCGCPLGPASPAISNSPSPSPS